MGFRIEDGSGNGYFVKVDRNRRLTVAATTLPIVADATQEGRAYSLVGSRTLASGSEETVLQFKNDNSQLDVHLQTIRVAVKTGAAGVKVISYFDVTRTSGGVLKTPVQLNRKSARLSGITCYDNSDGTLVVGTSNAQAFATFRVTGIMTLIANSDGALQLGPGDTYSVRVIGTAADIVDVTIFAYEADNSGA
jgi:hypothetical protein